MKKKKLKYIWDNIEVSKKEFFLKLKQVDKNWQKRRCNMFRAVLNLGNLEYISKNFKTKDEAETWILEVSEKQKIKRADILNKETNEREKVI